MKKTTLLAAAIFAALSVNAYATETITTLANNHTVESGYNLVSGPGNNKVVTDPATKQRTVNNAILGGWSKYQGENIYNYFSGTEIATEGRNVENIAIGDAVKVKNASYSIIIGNHITNENDEASIKKYGDRATMIKGDRVTVKNSPYATVLGQDTTVTNSYGAFVHGKGAVAENATWSVVMGQGASAKLAVPQKGASVVIGQGANTNSNFTIAIGAVASAKNYAATAIGGASEATGKYSLAMAQGTANGEGALSIGMNSVADKNASVSLGVNTKSMADRAVSIGYGATAKTNESVAIGTNANALAADTLAFGNNTISDVQNGVSIGANSTTTAGTNVDGITINGVEHKFAGGTADSVVSFGTNGRDGGKGVTNYNRQLQNVAAGRIDANSTDAVNGSQLNAVINSLNFTTVVDGDNTTVAESVNINGGKEFKVNVNKDLKNMNSAVFKDESTSKSYFTPLAHTPTTSNLDKRGETKIDGSVIQLHGPKEYTDSKDQVTSLTGSELKFVREGDYVANYNINGVDILQKDRGAVLNPGYLMINGHEDNDANKPYRELEFSVNKVDVGGQQIHGVTAGTADTDSVNVSQLKEVENKISSAGQITINQANHYTDTQVAKVGASASALAALHPLDYNPDHKTDIMGGVGHYKGKTAVALGVAHRPNENTMVTFGTTINGKDTMLNAGVSYKVGAKDSAYKSPIQMAKEIDDLKAIVDKLLKDNQELHKALENK